MQAACAVAWALGQVLTLSAAAEMAAGLAMFWHVIGGLAQLEPRLVMLMPTMTAAITNMITTHRIVAMGLAQICEGITTL